jgi:hypothetical protein
MRRLRVLRVKLRRVLRLKRLLIEQGRMLIDYFPLLNKTY